MTWTTFTLTAAGDDAYVGKKIGIELKNASNATSDNSSWIGMDNVRLNFMSTK